LHLPGSAARGCGAAIATRLSWLWCHAECHIQSGTICFLVKMTSPTYRGRLVLPRPAPPSVLTRASSTIGSANCAGVGKNRGSAFNYSIMVTCNIDDTQSRSPQRYAHIAATTLQQLATAQEQHTTPINQSY